MTGQLVRILALAGAIVAAQAACPHEGINKFWSDMNLSGDVEITEPVVLDTETGDLNTVVVKGEGSIIFSPDVDMAKLTSSRITVQDGGSVIIGSDDCRFDGNAEIELTGEKPMDGDIDEEFGHKFLGIKEGGSLEIFGLEKTSWTRLTKTLVPRTSIFTTEKAGMPLPGGLCIYEFDRNTGELKNTFEQLKWKKSVEKAAKGISKDSVLVIMNRGSMAKNGRSTWVYKRLDKSLPILSKISPDLNQLKTAWQDNDDAWVMMIDLATKKSTFVIDHIDPDKSDAHTGDVFFESNGIMYHASSKSSTKAQGSNDALIISAPLDSSDEYTLELEIAPKGWNAGDALVLASTDFDMNQAEEVVVRSVDGNKVTVTGELHYTHFGEIYGGVDMRAEVGLLTRNIKIYGRMGDKCVSDGIECDTVDFDMYGGQLQVIQGFKSVHIEGLEVTKMGQMNTLGAYPIHFHMCHETTAPIVKGNSIHHCFSRCVTIHGSHDITVENNVGHDTYGHCYFLEDGGERRTKFINNLGLTTRKGFLTPSDANPSTFWLVSPDTVAVGNAAAGADPEKGVGIWYLFPDEPVGPSHGLGMFQFREAKSTPVTAFVGNSAHSNGDVGLGFFRRLGPGHTIIGCSTYNPRVDPLDKNSDLTPLVLNDFTGYKNKHANVHMRATTVEMHGFKLAESPVGVLFLRNMIDGYQLLQDTLILGQTPNKGSGGKIKIRNEEGRWVWIDSDRSYAVANRAGADQVGVYVNSEGPLHLKGLTIKMKTDNIRRACAIKFHDKFRFGMGPKSSVEGLVFDEDIGTTVCHDNKMNGTDESSMILNDLDGSLTGTAGNAVVATDPFLHGNMDCKTNPKWNMSVCNGNFARLYVFPKVEDEVTTLLTRDGEEASDNFGSTRFTAYTVNADDKFVLHFSGKMKSFFDVFTTGLDKGQSLRLGLCMPMDVINEPLENFVILKEAINEAPSLAALDADKGFNLFMDKATGILYAKFSENDERGPQDLADCPGSLEVDKGCPRVRFNFNNMDVNLDDGNCLNRG